jgi:hypothetical protein
MKRTEQIIFQTLGLLVAALGCIATWLVVPQLEDIFSPPTIAEPQTADFEATVQAYETALENFSPPSLSGGVQNVTIRPGGAIDFETGRISTALSDDPDRQWDLLFICNQRIEALRALDGVTWVDRGITNLDALKYRSIRDANYFSKEYPNTGYTDLYHEHISNVPGENYVFLIKSPEGNIAKLQIMGYVIYDNNLDICRDMQVRYEVFPIVEDPPTPAPP